MCLVHQPYVLHTDSVHQSEDMANPVGITLGTVGLFTTAVDCFHYVKAGKNLREDYKSSLLQLDLLGLQLSHWGEAIGLTNTESNDPTLSVACTDEQKQKVRETLKEIFNLFKKAYKSNGKLTGVDANQVEESALTQNDASLRDLLQNLSLSRIPEHKRISLTKKTSWALSGRQELDMIITTLRQLIHQLVITVPPPPDQTLAACHVELKKIAEAKIEFIEAIKESVNKNEDDLMKKAIEEYDLEKAKAVSSNVEYTNTFQGDNNQVSQSGHNYGTSNVSLAL